VNPVLVDTTTVTVCSSQLPYTWNGQQLTAAGVYTDSLTSHAGCDSIATLILNVKPVLTETTTVIVCTSQLPYNWNGQQLTAAGVYTDSLTSQAGCDSIATLILNVNPVLTDTTTVTVCASQLPYIWNGQQLTAAGVYTDSLTSQAGCDSIETLILNVNPLQSSRDSISICQNQLPYAWNGNLYNAPGTYSDTLLSQFGCDSIATLVLSISPLATATISGSDTLCKGDSRVMSIHLTGNAPWRITYTDGTNTFTIDSIMSSPYLLTLSPTVTTTYTLTSVSSGGCTNILTNASITLTVIQTVQGIRYPNVLTTPLVNTPLSARLLGAGYSYSWSPPIGLSATDIRNPIFNYNNGVNYLITLTSPEGCKVVDTVRVIMRDPAQTIVSDIFVPKAWSPNRDGHNDRLRPLCVNIREILYFRIFNRWGQLVYETNIIGEGWDGIFRNKEQVSDTYTWTLEAYGLDGRHFKKSGNSILLR
jgi:gliding motility-associated-like protein